MAAARTPASSSSYVIPADQIDLAAPGGWAQAVLAQLGAPNNPSDPRGQRNIDFLEGWRKVEGTSARYNPLATTLRMPGSTGLAGNRDGVQEYASPVQGVQATARTIAAYPTFALFLRHGDPLGAVGSLARWAPHDPGYVNKLTAAFTGQSGSSDWTSFDAADAYNTAKSAAKKAADATGVSALASIAGSLSRFVQSLFALSTWRRVGLVVGGGLLILAGVIMLARQGQP